MLLFHTSNSWKQVCQHRNKAPSAQDGFYLPANLTAHVKLNKYTELTVAHEYIAHGGYIEHSNVGNFIRQYEQELAQLKESKYNPKIVIKLVKEFDKYLNISHKYYEGYAYWLEKQYAIQNGTRDIFDEKMETIHQYYHNLVSQIEKFDRQNGKKATIDWLFSVEL